MSMRRFVGPALLGLSGTIVLASLGYWQVQRLEWKEGILAEIEARIADAPEALPTALSEDEHKYMPVRVQGDLGAEHLRVLTSVPRVGPGHRVISVLTTEGDRRILIDEGFVPEGGNTTPGAAVGVTVTGNVHWPDDVNSSTPDPDLSSGLFFGRDVVQMAETLGTEPTLVVLKLIEGTPERATPLPVTTEGIPNSHLGYAVQWFGLALVWAGMTLFLLWRTARQTS
ncbi:MAG: SURF1 family protein [Pseudomonadota bacterium]